MRRYLIGFTLVLAMTTFLRPTHAGVVASSTFDTDSDGWGAVGLPYPTVGPPYTVIQPSLPTYVVAGGNPGGYLENTDNLNSTVYWVAPAKFLGNVSSVYGGTLAFDLFDAPNDRPLDQEDIIRIGGGKTVVYDTAYNPSADWTHYLVNIGKTGWKVDNLSGAEATQTDMLTVLSNLNTIYIRGEYQLGVDTRGIDNVVLTTAPISSIWKGPGGGSYNLASNWANNAVPNGVDAIANFSRNITAPSTVTLDSPVTLGTLVLNSPQSYTIAGAANLILQSSGTASINVLTGNHEISVPVVINSDTVINAAGTLNLSGGITGNHALTVLGTLTATSIQVDTLTIGTTEAMAVPEPSTFVLILTFGILVGWTRKRKVVNAAEKTWRLMGPA